VDGDFWHGRTLLEEGEEALRANFRTPRKEWWVKKITRNVERDKRVTDELRSMGWFVIREWESDLIANMPASVNEIVRTIRQLRKFRN
jgi:DNA mismatch endonuclease (patch repair protein)